MMTLREMENKAKELKAELDKAYEDLVIASRKDDFEKWCEADDRYMDALHAHAEINRMILSRI